MTDYRSCSIEGCDGIVIARGWCKKHWSRWRNRGDPLATPRKMGHVTDDGYFMVPKDGKKKMVHVLIAESILGRPLPIGAEVHHLDENKMNNDPSNLVICPSHAYHFLLHKRTRALAACGHAGWELCKFCHRYGDPDLMVSYGQGGNRPPRFVHRDCQLAASRQRMAEKKDHINTARRRLAARKRAERGVTA